MLKSASVILEMTRVVLLDVHSDTLEFDKVKFNAHSLTINQACITCSFRRASYG